MQPTLGKAQPTKRHSHSSSKPSLPLSVGGCGRTSLPPLSRLSRQVEQAVAPQGGGGGTSLATHRMMAPTQAPLTAEEALALAKAEKLELPIKNTITGYLYVNRNSAYAYAQLARPFQARGRLNGRQVSIGYYATAEEAALNAARAHATWACAFGEVMQAPEGELARGGQGEAEGGYSEGELDRILQEQLARLRSSWSHESSWHCSR